MIECNKSVDGKGLGKVVNKKRRARGGSGVKTFHCLCVTSPMHTRTTAALECGHLPLQVRPLKLLFLTLCI